MKTHFARRVLWFWFFAASMDAARLVSIVLDERWVEQHQCRPRDDLENVVRWYDKSFTYFSVRSSLVSLVVRTLQASDTFGTILISRNGYYGGHCVCPMRFCRVLQTIATKIISYYACTEHYSHFINCKYRYSLSEKDKLHKATDKTSEAIDTNCKRTRTTKVQCSGLNIALCKVTRWHRHVEWIQWLARFRSELSRFPLYWKRKV